MEIIQGLIFMCGMGISAIAAAFLVKWINEKRFVQDTKGDTK